MDNIKMLNALYGTMRDVQDKSKAEDKMAKARDNLWKTISESTNDCVYFDTDSLKERRI